MLIVIHFLMVFTEFQQNFHFEGTILQENIICAVTIARRSHLFPFRTQPLSFSAPRIVEGFPLRKQGVAAQI